MSKLNTLLITLLSLPCWGLCQDLAQIGLLPVRGQVHILLEMTSGNIGVMHGKDGFLIIDTQFESHYERIAARLEEVGQGGVVYAINTHFHYDHADGNKAFGPQGTTIVAHRNARSRLMTDQRVIVPGLNTTDQKQFPSNALPSITYDSTMDLHFNGETIRLHHLINAHTDTDTLVQLVNANVLHAGDVFVRYGLPYIDTRNGGSVRGMIRAQSTILSLCDDETLIIPGHGGVCKPDEVRKFKANLETIVNGVKAARSKGLSRESINQSNIIEEVLGDSKGFIPPHTFLSIIQDELDADHD